MNQIENENLNSSEEQADQDKKLVPVVESIRYRKRAQSAEQKATQLEEELAQSRTTISQLNEQLQQIQTEQQLTAELAGAGAADIETAALLVKARLKKEPQADAATVISQLRKEKAYLFTENSTGTAAAVPKTAGAKEKMPSVSGTLQRAAKKASDTGSRADLQEYLKLRRNFV